MSRAAKEIREAGRQFNIVQHDVLMEGTVAEQHVKELSGVVACGVGSQGDANFELPVFLLCDRLDLAHDLRPDKWIIDRRKGHLDALLDGERLRTSLDRTCVGANVIGGVEARMHERPVGQMLPAYGYPGALGST